MGKLDAHISVSVDGYVNDAEGALEWCSTDAGYDGYIDEMLDSIGVFSHAPLGFEWHNSRVLEGDPAAALRAAARESERDIAVFAGAGAVMTALGLGVLDELRLVVHPAIIGSGTRLFDTLNPLRPLQLLDLQRFDCGILALRYAVDAPTARSRP